MQKQLFDDLYDTHVAQPSAAYRATVGEPVNLNPAAFSDLVSRLSDFQHVYPGMDFWMIVQHKDLSIPLSGGDMGVFGYKLKVFKDYFRTVHPDYLLPYFRWRSAAYALIFRQSIPLEPLQIGYRQSVPLKVKDGEYYWFTMYSTIAQLDAAGKIVSNLHSFYQEAKWSLRTLRPFEASLQIKKSAEADLERNLIDTLSLSLIDEFTNAELDVLSAYASGKTVDDVLLLKSWSRHTLHEYNANLLKKAKNLFVYDFRNARAFAEYCLDKGFIRPR